MPIKKCTKDGKSGFKYGDSGTCYTGPGARKKAAKQGQAIEISKHAKGAPINNALALSFDILADEIDELIKKVKDGIE